MINDHLPCCNVGNIRNMHAISEREALPANVYNGGGTNAPHLALAWVVSQQVPLRKLITEVVTALEDSRCKSNNLRL